MKSTPQAWWCQCDTRNTPHMKACGKCGQAHHERYATVRAQERSVVYYNQATGEHRTPARADQPMPEVYAAQGYERREIESMISWEKEAGVVHEATTFNSGNEDCPTRDITVKHDPANIRALAEDMGRAFASGEWTGHEKLV